MQKWFSKTLFIFSILIAFSSTPAHAQIIDALKEIEQVLSQIQKPVSRPNTSNNQSGRCNSTEYEIVKGTHDQSLKNQTMEAGYSEFYFCRKRDGFFTIKIVYENGSYEEFETSNNKKINFQYLDVIARGGYAIFSIGEDDGEIKFIFPYGQMDDKYVGIEDWSGLQRVLKNPENCYALEFLITDLLKGTDSGRNFQKKKVDEREWDISFLGDFLSGYYEGKCIDHPMPEFRVGRNGPYFGEDEVAATE